MKLVGKLFVAASLVFAANAFAKDAKQEPNCEVKGKKEHVKDEAACTAKKGKWLVKKDAAAAAPAEAAPAEQPAGEKK